MIQHDSICARAVNLVNTRMRLHEISSTKFDPLLVEFWKKSTPDQLKRWFTINGCYDAALHFNDFLESKGIMWGDVIKIGTMRNGRKSGGWFHADLPDTDQDALTPEDAKAMAKQGLDPRKLDDRVRYIRDNGLEDEFKWIPHSWVELRGEILDPSGFYLDGTSGQFDRLVKDKTNLTDRYRYFR